MTKKVLVCARRAFDHAIVKFYYNTDVRYFILLYSFSWWLCRKGASLKPKHTIFLSHSGVHRDFTEQLCKDLEALQYFSFCDIRPDSLPKGEEFPPLIIKAAGQCRLAILVLSREYFMRSKWPMVELTEFVRAQRSINPDLRIVPLYFKISVDEFKDARTRASWKKKWQTWKNADSRIDVKEWVRATKVLEPINGIVYDEAQGEVTYRSKVVKAICKLTPPDLEWDDSHIKALPRLCEVCKHYFPRFHFCLDFFLSKRRGHPS